MHPKYDQNNIFAKILRKEIECTQIYEDDHVLCFEDISRTAPIHWLVIPKKGYCSFTDFTANASSQEVSNFFISINKIIKENNLEKNGFKLITNNGKNVGQTVFHFHVHILSGTTMKE